MPASRSISRSSSTNGMSQFARERAAERRLAGAAQADERDALASRGGFLAPKSRISRKTTSSSRCAGKPLEEAADQPLLDRALARVEELGERHRRARARRCAAGAPTRCLRRLRAARDSARRRRRFARPPCARAPVARATRAPGGPAPPGRRHPRHRNRSQRRTVGGGAARRASVRGAAARGVVAIYCI